VKKLFLGLIFILSIVSLQAQQQLRVVVSKQIEERGGKLFYVHTVQKGQTVYAIAKAYEVSVDEIYYENPDSENGISIDQQLWIPTISKEQEVNQELKTADFDFFYHIASTNESLSHISKLYNVSEMAIRNANPLLMLPLRKGEYIKIPVRETEDREDEVSFNPNIPVIPDFRHTITYGETLQSIARKYKTTQEKIRAVNPGLGSHPAIGQRLRIPSPPDSQKQEEQVAQKTEYIRYKIKKRETLYSIARDYGLTVDDIYDANEGLTYRIYTGQVIRIPRITIANTYIVHKITKTTKIKKVAKLYKIPVADILDINPSLGSKLYAGQTVKIPVGNKATIAGKLPSGSEEIEEKPKEEPVEPAVPIGCDKQKNRTNKTFRIALMLPLFLEEMDSLDVDRFLATPQDSFKPFRFIHYYEGVLIAVDSLRAQGMQIELFVYDVDKSIIKTTKVLQKPEIRQMDLIIGPFFNQSFDQVALFAGNFRIPIVNPLSFREETVEKYRTVIKMKSGTKYQADMLRAIVPEYYPEAKVFLVTQTPYKDADKLVTLQNKLASVLPQQIKISNTDIYNLAVAVAHRDEEFDDQSPIPAYNLEGRRMEPQQIKETLTDSTIFDNSLSRIVFTTDGLDTFMETASPLRTNLVVVYGDNKAFVMDVMNKLNEFRDSLHIQLIGMPSWERFKNLDKVQCNNMNLMYFSTYYYNYQSENTLSFVREFKQRFETEPNTYGFAGFDNAYYILQALFRFDNNLYRCLEYAPKEMLHGIYHFEKTGKAKNLENTYWNLLRYNNYEIQKLPDLLTPANVPD
jgi:LysM repeat protein